MFAGASKSRGSYYAGFYLWKDEMKKRNPLMVTLSPQKTGYVYELSYSGYDFGGDDIATNYYPFISSNSVNYFSKNISVQVKTTTTTYYRDEYVLYYVKPAIALVKDIKIDTLDGAGTATNPFKIID